MVFALLAENLQGQPGGKILSHPPMRPLAKVSHRDMEKGPAFFVDAAKGNDGQDGSQGKPWKTLQRAVKDLKPGDTLFLRGGTYYEHVAIPTSGTRDQPITIRSFPGELAILDGGLREFFEDPAGSWAPFAEGAPGEFRSTKTYPHLGGRDEEVNMLGNFGDSMVPLHGYRFMRDLRGSHMFWKENIRTDPKEGIYCGPGIYLDVKTGRIHVRLAHTSLKGLGEDNYRGETDPRKVPLVIAGFAGGSPLSLHGVKNLCFQDLVVRGSRGPAIDMGDGENLVFDGLTVYGGSAAFRVKDTVGLRLAHTACRGIAAPWTFRGSLKYRSIEARIFSASGWLPTGRDSRDFELAYCEFTDCVDGVFLGNVRGVRFHHNLVDNISDDGIFLTAGTAFDGTTHGGDVHIYQNRLSRCLTTLAFGVGHGRQKILPGGKQTGSGVFVFRNIFDFRRPVMYHQPTSPDGPQEITSSARLASDHGSPTWEPMFIYHNTIIARDPLGNFYGCLGLADHLGGGGKRRVFNNIVVQMEKLPGLFFPSPDLDLHADGNLLWCAAELGPEIQEKFFAKFRLSKVYLESKKRYPPGWTTQDRFADPKFTGFETDWKKPMHLSLQKDSPAIDSGLDLPDDWPDPVRGADAGRPDRGVLPLGGQFWQVGVHGRLTMFGEEKLPVRPPEFTSAPVPPMANNILGFQPTAIQQGYPAFDAPLLHFALRKRGVPVDTFDKVWLDPRDYGKYKLVAVVGSLVRAKIVPTRYAREDLPRVRKYLEEGGTLLTMRVGQDVFATGEGREFLADLTGISPKENPADIQILQPGHPWIKHLDPKKTHPWLTDRLQQPLRTGKGDRIIGTPGGNASLYRIPVGKGQLIYLGWEISTSLPSGVKANLDQERIFEEQMQILLNIVADLYPAGQPLTAPK